MPPSGFPAGYVNKTVSMKFMGRESVFHLSHGLFSSNDIDAGTRLLLKGIAARVDLSRLGSILDVGCGVGTLGVALARAAPQARVHMQDRDALAVAFARENCAANAVDNADLNCCLAFWNLPDRLFDLVVSNLPAKAGRPVLTHFFRAVPGFLSRAGTAAVVIVSPLARLARDAIQSRGFPLLHEESTSQHTVFFFQKPESSQAQDAPRDDLGPYLRSRARFESCGVHYELDTAFDLPDFDTLGYSVTLAQGIMAGRSLQGHALFWNPGQGHLPVFAHRKAGRGIQTVSLAGHDALEIALAERNLAAAGRAVSRSLLVPCEAGLAEVFEPGSVDFVCALPHPVPKAPWHRDLAASAEKLLRKGGAILAAGASTEVFRIVSQCRPFRLEESVKRFGHRAVLLRLI